MRKQTRVAARNLQPRRQAATPLDNMQDRAIEGTIDWKKYEIVLDVPEGSVDIAFGILLDGKGQAWVDDLQFDVVGKDVQTMDMSEKRIQKKPLSLGFEK